MTSRNLGGLLLVVAFVSSAFAQEKTEKAADTPNAELLRRLLEKVDQLDRDLKTVLKNAPKALPENPADRKLVALLETPVIQTFSIGVRNNQSIEQRVFVAKLTLINLTPDAKTVESSQITLDADGTSLKNGMLDATVLNYSLTIGQQGHQISQLKPTPTLKVASGQTATTWVVFGGLPRGPGLPKLKLSIADGDKPTEIDINAWAAAKLDFSSQRLGPRGCLALLTIGGELNFVSYGALVEELERLASQKVTRVVIRWAEGAPAIDLNLSYQFIGMAQSLGRTDQMNQQLPSLPQSFTEFRLAELPTPNQSQSNYGVTMYGPAPNPNALANASVVHKTTADAVMAALRTAYEVVPRNELLDDIRSSDSLTRAAALAAGGGRLASEHLPLIMQLADDNDVALQKSALVALRHFGEPEAIEKLLGYARKNTEPLASMAVESLAGSRYSAAHDALLGLLERETAESRKTIVKVLAQYPRPIWSETIYKYVRDPQGGLGIDGLQALVRVGHPKLVEVLKDTLDSRDSAMREAAFNELVNQSDSASEQIATQYTLKHMESAPPTPAMLAFLTKTKDQASVPLLLKHLKNSAADRTGLINALAQIGDQTVADMLVEHYGTLRPNEQVAVLGILGQLKSPAFLKLAAGALESADASIVSTACQWLQNDASSAAVKLLIQTLEKTTQPNTIIYTANALGQVATVDARAALRKARSSNDPNKQAQGRQALTILYQRSPAMQYVYQAQQFERQKDHKAAMELYDQAIKTDPELPIAYSERANVFIRLDKYPEAKKDFEKAVALDDLNHMAVTGLGICLAVEGKFEEGIKVGEDLRSKYANDGLYCYNIACIYGRAVEKLLKDDKLPDREKKLEAYRRKALDDLRESQKLGYNDQDWTQKDPDLASLHDLPEFQELSGLKPKP
ncbi:MAG: tetratricopeptide repeat protein [Planctomycetaceae bacterium]|nr:tetratricopeptide repeat protein [Planctomycetaceae bacterium]